MTFHDMMEDRKIQIKNYVYAFENFVANCKIVDSKKIAPTDRYKAPHANQSGKSFDRRK